MPSKRSNSCKGTLPKNSTSSNARQRTNLHYDPKAILLHKGIDIAAREGPAEPPRIDLVFLYAKIPKLNPAKELA